MGVATSPGKTPPSKTCASCGRTIEWRRKWARNGDEIRYCSDACRRRKVSDVDVALQDALRAAVTRPGATVDPADVAALVGAQLGQDDLAEPARRAARRLVADGGFEIVAGGRVVDPSTAKGAFELRRR